MKIKPLYIVIGVAVIGVVLFCVIMLATSLKRLDSYEVGLKYDTVGRKLGEETQNEGLHNGVPGFKFIKFSSVFTSIHFTDLQCLNKDGLSIILSVSYQYRVRPNELYNVVMDFKDNATYETVLEHSGRAAIMESCSLYTTTQYQSERGLFQSDVGEKLTARYSPLNADVSEIQVNNIQRPLAYDSAVRDKETAKENIEVAQNERPRMLVEANTTLEQSRANALIAVAYAESQSRIINERAGKEAEAILNQYEKETAVYERVITDLGLTTEGFLSYIGVRAISSATHDVYVGLQGPAKTSYVTP